MNAKEYINKGVGLCRQIEDLFDDDCRGLSTSLYGELYDKYKEVIIKEKRILNSIEDHLKQCMNANYY